MKNILVCVTQQKNCERLIRKAEEILLQAKANIHVLHVATSENHLLGQTQIAESETLEYLFSVAKSIGADLSVQINSDPLSAISDYVKDNNIDMLIIGASGKKGIGVFAETLSLRLPSIEFCIIQ